MRSNRGRYHTVMGPDGSEDRSCSELGKFCLFFVKKPIMKSIFVEKMSEVSLHEKVAKGANLVRAIFDY